MDEWMNVQRDYDILIAKKRNSKIKVKPLKTVNIEFIQEIFKKYKFKSKFNKHALDLNTDLINIEQQNESY